MSAQPVEDTADTPPADATRGDGGDSAATISVLDGLEAVRRRPGMYIGSNDARGLQHLLWEVIDNSVDEALPGYASRIEVTLHADGSVTVTDDGGGASDGRHGVGVTVVNTPELLLRVFLSGRHRLPLTSHAREGGARACSPSGRLTSQDLLPVPTQRPGGACRAGWRSALSRCRRVQTLRANVRQRAVMRCSAGRASGPG